VKCKFHKSYEDISAKRKITKLSASTFDTYTNEGVESELKHIEKSGENFDVRIGFPGLSVLRPTKSDHG